MFQLFCDTTTPPTASSANKIYRRRFGVIPSEPCRASSMQLPHEIPFREKGFSEQSPKFSY